MHLTCGGVGDGRWRLSLRVPFKGDKNFVLRVPEKAQEVDE